jgi:hypothetical protein
VLRTLVLIHSPLVGALTWQSTAEILRVRGYRVLVPSLAGIVDAGPPYYRNLAAAGAAAIGGLEATEPVGLVAHSGAGGLIPAVASASKTPVSFALFVDAILPHPGRSWMETVAAGFREELKALARAGWLPPWNSWFPAEELAALLPDDDLRRGFLAELRPIPLSYFEEPAPAFAGWPQVRCAYLRLSEAYDQTADAAERLGWPTHRRSSDHLAMLTRPGEVAEALLLLLRKLEESSR